MSRQADDDVLLIATIKIDQLASGKITLGMASGKQYTARLPVHAALANLPRNTWMRVGIPLKCFRNAGVDMRHVRVPFRLQTAAHDVISISKVAVGTHVDHTLPCTATTK
jgi:beta-glucosidase